MPSAATMPSEASATVRRADHAACSQSIHLHERGTYGTVSNTAVVGAPTPGTASTRTWLPPDGSGLGRVRDASGHGLVAAWLAALPARPWLSGSMSCPDRCRRCGSAVGRDAGSGLWGTVRGGLRESRGRETGCADGMGGWGKAGVGCGGRSADTGYAVESGRLVIARLTRGHFALLAGTWRCGRSGAAARAIPSATKMHMPTAIALPATARRRLFSSHRLGPTRLSTGPLCNPPLHSRAPTCRPSSYGRMRTSQPARSLTPSSPPGSGSCGPSAPRVGRHRRRPWSAWAARRRNRRSGSGPAAWCRWWPGWRPWPPFASGTRPARSPAGAPLAQGRIRPNLVRPPTLT